MESLLEIIIKNGVECKELLLWLNSSQQISILNDYNHLKYDFIPLFLNFLRDESSKFLPSSSVAYTGLPWKFSALIKSSKYTISNEPSEKLVSCRGINSKGKTLNFSEDSIGSHRNFTAIHSETPSDPLPFKHQNKRSPQLASLALNESPISSQSFKNCSTSTPKTSQPKTLLRKSDGNYDHRNDRSNFSHVRVSERMAVLADYIIVDTSSAKKQLKKRGVLESSQNGTNDKISCAKEETPKFDIKDKEAFPAIGSIPAKREVQKVRRINPTPVVPPHTLSSSGDLVLEKNASMSFGVPRKTNEPSVFRQAPETKANSLDEERKLLKEEKRRFLNFWKNSSGKSSEDSSSSLRSIASSPNTTSERDSVFWVKSQEELVILARIYSCFILYNMIPNLMVELYFLFQLLTVEDRGCNEDVVGKVSFLSSSQNCIFFAVKTLSFLTDCFTFLDRSLLKALSENTRIISFHPNFQERLLNILDASSVSKPSVKTNPKSPILSVSFQLETDNRNNFPNTLSFQLFRKQRDLFYEMLRIWENNHLNPGWSYAQGLGSQIKQLLVLQSEPTNLTHLARLFQSQLVTMCRGDELIGSQQSNADKDPSFLCQLKQQHPEKYKRLYERLITPSRFGGPVPPPSFPGAQEFFRNFIVVASSYTFNTHLRNVLVTELSTIQWRVTNLEDKEQHGELLVSEVTSLLSSLRLLAKFLGFLEFLPHHTTEVLTGIVIGNQATIRHKVMPPIPLLKMLKEGISCRCLVSVVPWIVEYLSMVDPVAFHTQYYLTLVFGLIHIYKALYVFNLEEVIDPSCPKCSQARELGAMSGGNTLYLKLLLGWLLSLPNVPEGLFYLQEEEVDIDETEFKVIKELFISSYIHPCLDCLYIPSDIAFNFVENEFSPIKAVNTVTPHKRGIRNIQPMDKGLGESPLKTPSKFFRMSMIETPEGTPIKPSEDGTYSFTKCSLDSYNLIDSDALLELYPFFHELKAILNDFAQGSSRSCNGGSNVRKITPFSAPEKMNEPPEKMLQILLEENFFHNQPSSMKKTVEFVVERIFSNVLRSVRSIIIPSLKEECVSQLRVCVSSTMADQSALEKVYETVEKRVFHLSTELASQVRQEVLDRTGQLTQNEDVKNTLRFLLPVDITQNKQDMCYKIITRSVHKKVSAWINAHLSTGFCTQELTTEAHKYIKQIQKNMVNLDNSSRQIAHSNTFNETSFTLGTTEDQSMESHANTSYTVMDEKTKMSSCIAQHHKDESTCPSLMLQIIKVDLKALLVSPTHGFALTQDDEILARLLQLRDTALHRCDVTLPLFKALQTMTADWMAALCVCRPSAITDGIVKTFCKMWLPRLQGGIFPTASDLTVFLSPRIITLLGQQEEKEMKIALKNLENILVEMVVKMKVISIVKVQESFIALMRYSWPEEILESISRLISNFSAALNIDDDLAGGSDLAPLLDWIGWATSEMEIVDS